MEDLYQTYETASVEDVVEEVVVEPVMAEEPILIKEEVASPPAKKSKTEHSLDKNSVLLYSAKDFSKISKGYFKEDKKVAVGLLKNKNIRLATEQEIKEYFNK